MTKVISVFGSSRPERGTAVYELSYQVGYQLAQAGFAVATGGYFGTMGAVSEGAAAANGRVIGVTCEQIEKQFNRRPNLWITEEIKYPTLRERLHHLVEQNDGMITLPGGIGTLSEISLAWSFMQTGEMAKRPLILLGEIWRETVDTFRHPDYLPDAHLELIQHAYSPEECVSLLNGDWRLKSKE